MQYPSQAPPFRSSSSRRSNHTWPRVVAANFQTHQPLLRSTHYSMLDQILSSPCSMSIANSLEMKTVTPCSLAKSRKISASRLIGGLACLFQTRLTLPYLPAGISYSSPLYIFVMRMFLCHLQAEVVS